MKKGTNAAEMRRQNEKTILSLIHARPVSRAEIAQTTGLTRAAVTIIIDELIQKGYVTERQTRSSAVGRQPIELLLNGSAVYTVGINITRDAYFVGISDLCGNLIVEQDFALPSPAEFFAQVIPIVEEQLRTFKIDRNRIYGIGVVAPGPLDSKSKTILNPPNFAAWHHINLGQEMRKNTDFEIILENVSNGTALAEKYFGSAIGVENFITLLIDDGIGSGLILGNRLFQGVGELGHTSIQHNGIACECGNRGCLERYASIPAVLDGTDIPDWEYAVDHEMRDVLEREAEYLSTAIINVNNMFSLDKVILCGKVSYKPQALIALISEKVAGKTLSAKSLPVCAGKVSSKSLIASAAAVHSFFAD